MKEKVQVLFIVVLCGAVAWLGRCVPDALADSPDPIVRLGGVARAWRPRWRGDIKLVAEAVAFGCATIPWPDRRSCEPLVLAVAFRESAWRWRVVGDHPYRSVGLMQLHGAALGRSTREAARDPRTNVWLGLRWLHEAGLMCVRWSGNPSWVERSLSAYAGLGCHESGGARLALRWAAEIDRIRGRP